MASLNTITTSNTSNSTLTINSGLSTGGPSNTSGYVYTNASCKYHLLGNDIEVESYFDTYTAMILSLINTIGIEYYVQLKKNNVILHKDIEKILKSELKKHNRNKNIDNIIKKD